MRHTPGGAPAANRPFRWDLVRPDQLGSLLDGCDPPDLWFVDELVGCAARVLAGCGDGEPYFVGRSADSVFDLLSGALSGTSWRDRPRQLPLSLYGREDERVTGEQLDQLRANLAAHGIAPASLARRRRPVVFVDLVSSGSTFENLYHVVRDWVADERAQWDVIRRKLRFIGITVRRHSSPNTWRWQQHAGWTEELPRRSIRNVSLSGAVWSYLGNEQPKITPSFSRRRWSEEEINHPRRGEQTRTALAEAVALVEYGRRAATRRRLVRHIVSEPTGSEPWLRSLVRELGAAS